MWDDTLVNDGEHCTYKYYIVYLVYSSIVGMRCQGLRIQIKSYNFITSENYILRAWQRKSLLQWLLGAHKDTSTIEISIIHWSISGSLIYRFIMGLWVIEGLAGLGVVSCTKYVWYSEHGTYHRFKIILEQAMSATHIAVIPCTRTSPDEEEFPKEWLSWGERWLLDV